MSNYYELHIKNLNSNQEDLLSATVFEMGAQGISEYLEFTQSAESFDPKIQNREVKDLVVYFKGPLSQEQILYFQAQGIQCHVEKKTHKDWLVEWKKFYRPFVLVNDYWVIPEWWLKEELKEVGNLTV